MMLSLAFAVCPVHNSGSNPLPVAQQSLVLAGTLQFCCIHLNWHSKADVDAWPDSCLNVELVMQPGWVENTTRLKLSAKNLSSQYIIFALFDQRTISFALILTKLSCSLSNGITSLILACAGYKFRNAIKILTATCTLKSTITTLPTR